MIPLLDKADNFELIRDRVASILATETAAQQQKATQAGKDPAAYKFRVFSERTNPFESFVQGADVSPLINVWFSDLNFDKAKSNCVDRQQGTSTIQIDCMAYAVSTATQAGHAPGDEAASKAAHKVARLVRNIIMHDDNRTLQFSHGTVARRWISTIGAFNLASQNPEAMKVKGVRLTLEVDHIETTMLADENTIEFISIDFSHTADGDLIAEIDYNLTPVPEPEE
jgi:hypothetical protein